MNLYDSKKVMKISVGLSTGLLLLFFYLDYSNYIRLEAVYSENYRLALMSGFLATASFLYAIQTFTFIKFKEVYYSDSYIEHIKQFEGLVDFNEIIKPIQESTNVFMKSIFVSLFTSFLLFVLSFAENRWLIFLELGYIFTSFILLFYCMMLQWHNFNSTIDRLNSEIQAKLTAKNKKKRKKNKTKA